MNIITYAITEETYTLPGGSVSDSRISYGIAAYADGESTGTAAIVASVHDISGDKDRILYLVRECNRLELSPMHLADVVQDFLAQ